MDLKQIKTFSLVAKHKSFSQASKILNIAQPAVSRQVQALEQEFKTKLLYRTTRGVELTDKGKVLVSMGEKILTMAEEIREALVDPDQPVPSEVTIGILPSVMAFFTAPLLEECRRSYPHVTVHVAEGVDPLLKEWLAAGKIDLGIMTDKGSEPEFVQVPLASEELILVSDPRQIMCEEDAISASDLANIPIIIGRGFQERIDPILKRNGVHIPYVMASDNIKMIREMIGRSPYYTILTREYISREIDEGTLKMRPIKDPALTRQLVLATDRRRPTTQAMKAVASLVRSHAKKLN